MLLLGLGMVLFTVGGVTRTYMNAVIGRSSRSEDHPGTRSTELRYWRLIKEQGAAAWPLLVTVVFIPLGISIAFTGVIWSNRVGGR